MSRARSLFAALAAVLTGAALLALRAQPPAGNKGVEATFGLDVIAAIVADSRNVVLPIRECALEGFEEDLLTEYRAPSVRRTAPSGRIRATVPKAGTFYPGFIFYDTRGRESIAISIDGTERGVAVADRDDNRQYLFFLDQPHTFRGGEIIELRALTGQSAYRTEDLVLLAAKPAARKHDYVISDIFAQPRLSGGKASASVAWITNWPAAGTVEWDGGKVTEDAPAANHRVVLENLASNRAYRFRITAQGREGRRVASPWQTFRTDPAAEPAGEAGSARLPLRVEDPAADFPVTSGVPFPKGVLGSDAHLRLLDADGTATLARWDDGTVKWALLDFAAGGGTCSLEYGAGVRRKAFPSPLAVTDGPERITIVTGPAKFTIGKRRFGFLESAWVDANHDGRFDDGERIISPGQPGAFHLTGPDGTVYTSLAPPSEVVVEENGPLRAVVRVSGEHRAADGRTLFAYVVRFHAYAGRGFLRVQHTFGNNSAGSEFTSIRGLALRVPLVPSGYLPRRWTLGETYSGAFHGAQGVRLRQHTDDRYFIDADGPRDAAQGKRAADWAEWSDGARTVTLAVRDLWRNYPKDVTVSPEGLDLALCPPLAADEYARAKGTVDEHRLYYYLQNGVYKLRQGVTKTHDIWLDFAAAGGQASALRARRAPLLAVAPPRWYSGSKAFGELAAPGSAGILARYDAFFGQVFEAYLGNREKNREYGMLNFGDWWGERVVNWGNSEYDTQHSFFMQFARTGEPRYFRAGEEMEWHNRDVDTVHYHADPARIGGVYTHCVGHTGDYYASSPPPGTGIAEGGFKVSHSFIEGHLDYYFLTGDRRSFDTSRVIADHYNRDLTTNYDYTNSRNAGWHLILTEAMYEATYDRTYLNAAKIVFERVLERQTSDGGWRRFLTDDHCNCLPRHQGEAGFMVGVLLTGLRQYYELSGDERAAESVVRGARYLIDGMWIPKISGFRYTSCPRTSAGAWSNFLLFDGIAFAHRRTGDPRLRDVLVAGTGSTLANLPAIGKSFTQYTRVTPHFLAYLDQLSGAGK